MLIRLMSSLFATKYPMFYSGRHRRPMARSGEIPLAAEEVDAGQRVS